MAAPSNPPQLLPLEQHDRFFFGSHEQRPEDNIIGSMNPANNQLAGQNHNRDNNIGALPPLSAVLPQDTQTLHPPATESVHEPNNSNRERPSDSDRASGSDGSESDEEDEEPVHDVPWRPMEEDPSEPCDDEMVFISAKEERSALDRTYWEKETFFELEDPELASGESGRIDWLVERFNGTADNPNNQYVMRSSTVRIGGYDWCIKFYPKGNNTDYLSVYVECPTMQSPDFEEEEEFQTPPLPFLTGLEKLKKRRSVAVQLSVVMYNPNEPRVYEYQTDAHQFTKKYSDYGWTRFSRYSRRDFTMRNHGQRQALLRNDKLAFAAHIRIVHDPTGCLWSHGSDPFDDSIALTGLRPFSPQFPWVAAQLPLLHFGPFREFIRSCKDAKIVFWLQTLLWKTMSRKHSSFYGQTMHRAQDDPITSLIYLARCLRKETSPQIVNELIGTLDQENGGVIGTNRLKTKRFRSIQAAVDAHPALIETPALLTLELERQEFDRKKRKWRKLTNKVEMQDKITVSGTTYTLLAFATHCGDLESHKFHVYTRPNGRAGMWYKYTENSVTCLTHKQAIGKYSGFDDLDKTSRHKHVSSSRVDPALRGWRHVEERNEVANMAVYVREDCAHTLSNSCDTETWDVPSNVLDGIPPSFSGVEAPAPATAVYETFAESENGDVQPGAAQDDQVGLPPPNSDDVLEIPPSTVPTQMLPSSDDMERRRSFDEDAGYATPNCWPMDGEDVIMSDADDDSEQDEEGSARVSAVTTIDHLGREYYQGQVLGAKYHGQGHLIALNGDEYRGHFRDGLKEGKGKMIYAMTGNIYEGDWLEGEQHGYGKLTEIATGNVFEGGWKHGKKHGQFVLKGTVTDEDKGCCSICYDKEITTAFYDCGHVIACKECAHKIDSCPICRKRVLARLELFGVKMSFE